MSPANSPQILARLQFIPVTGSVQFIKGVKRLYRTACMFFTHWFHLLVDSSTGELIIAHVCLPTGR